MTQPESRAVSVRSDSNHVLLVLFEVYGSS